MGAPRAWTTISGQTVAGKAIDAQGEETLRTVWVDPTFARITVNRTVTPPRVELTASTTGLALQVQSLSESVAALTVRVTALETNRLTPTALKTANYTAVAWEHVLVDMAAASGNVTITMPTSPAPAIGDRVRVSDVAAGGGAGVGFLLRVAATFAATSTTHYATSPYSIADIGSGGSVVGANAELVYVGTGWYLVAETCQPVQLT